MRRAVALNFEEAIWLRAELSEASERSGNWYLTLVEQDGSGQAAARLSAAIWKRTYATVIRRRGKEAASVLRAGQEVVIRGKLDFHERFGLKFVVSDWDPSFTIGQLELRRQEIRERLRAERLLERQQAHSLPPVVQRLAVLTSERAAGYADFLNQLLHNEYGYHFELELFDIAVQGARTLPSVLEQLDNIRQRSEEFDAVALLRGGGSKIDLSGFDHYEVGAALAAFPLPVLTGIGHETDETLPDLVAHTALKTPTALAEFLLSKSVRYESEMLRQFQRVQHYTRQHHQLARQRLHTLTSEIRYAADQQLRQQAQQTRIISLQVRETASRQLRSLRSKLELQEQAAQTLAPAETLRRGFVLVSQANRLVRSTEQLNLQEPLTLHFSDGSVRATLNHEKS